MLDKLKRRLPEKIDAGYIAGCLLIVVGTALLWYWFYPISVDLEYVDTKPIEQTLYAADMEVFPVGSCVQSDNLVYSWGRPLNKMFYQRAFKLTKCPVHDQGKPDYYKAKARYGGSVTKPEAYIYKVSKKARIQEPNSTDDDAFSDVKVKNDGEASYRTISSPYDELMNELKHARHEE